MKDHIKAYKEKLKKGICEYMEMPVSKNSADVVRSMIKCYQKVCEMEFSTWNTPLTDEDLKHWNAHMINADGTDGGHWTEDQTTAVAQSIGLVFEHITPAMWNAAMNMIYSDYGEVATKFGVGTPEFFADMAKAFLFDKDGGMPKEKLSAYYHSIVDRDY